MKIGIFGGSFDPIHLGHTRIINEAIISLQLDKMLIVPTKHNPWKEDSVANNQQRIEMIQIALKDNSKCEVCTLEIDRQDNEKNYSITENLFLSKIIELGNINLKPTKEEEKFYITVYDEEIEDSKIELKDIEKKDLKIKLNKKTKLFI